ncbi:MAG: thioredoxin, partial [Burkholderiales bacterium]|nr:thioredoxin [Burkholderiales bacterium]
TRPRRVVIAEFELDGTRRLRDWSRRELTQADFARANRARVAPTLRFCGARGQTLAEPIVGMSRDFFGAYLDERIAAALRAAA